MMNLGISRRLAQWLNRQTYRWPLRHRVLASMLVVDIAIGVVVLGLALIFGWLQPAAVKAGPLPLSIAAIIASLSLLLLTLLTTYALVRSVSTRIDNIAVQLQRQMASGDLDIAVSPEHEDEIGRLIVLLNQLGQSYRASLQTLARNADEMAVLDLITSTINRTLDLQEVLDTSLREALKIINWDAGAIYMWDARTESLNMVSFTGLSEETVRNTITHKLGEGLIGQSTERRIIMFTGGGIHTSEFAVAGSPGWPATQISLPLVTVPGHLLGTLALATGQKRTLTSQEVALLKTVSEHIALAIDKAQLYTQVSEHAVELEQIVAARTEQLSQAIDELWIALKQAREADRIKSLLLSTVSHELRTPLATIKGSTSLLIEHHRRIPTRQLMEHLRDIEEETDKLTELISNLLDMSRIEAGSLHIEMQTLNLVEVIQSSVVAATVRHNGRRIAFHAAEDSLMTTADPRRVDQILSNLVDNAVKYSAPETRINVTVQKTDAEVIVSVVDSGIGIAPEHLEHIFERFFQVKTSGGSGRHGIGLGLAICRGLVEAQGGRIWVESTPGQGSTFSFGLPLAEEAVKGGKRESQ